MDRKLGGLIFVALALTTKPAEGQTAVFSCFKDGEPRSYTSKPLPSDWDCKAIIAKKDERWVQVASTSWGDPVEVDQKTVVRSGKEVTAWVQYWSVFQAAKLRNTAIQRTVSRVEFSCLGGTAKTLRTAIYYLDGTNGEPIMGVSPKAQPIVPGSIEESVSGTLCK